MRARFRLAILIMVVHCLFRLLTYEGMLVADPQMFRADDTSNIPQLVPAAAFFAAYDASQASALLSAAQDAYRTKAAGQLAFVRVFDSE